jgi:hypothetical protein
MPAPCASDVSVYNELRLPIPVLLTPPELDAVLDDIRSRACSGLATRFVFDCSGLSELPLRLVTEIAALRRELRREGAEVVLICCDPSLRRQLESSELADLTGQPSVRHAAHPLNAPHATFLRAFGRA